MRADTSSEKLPLIVLAGPTAVGKTGLSLKLAKAVGGSVISADSMQVYRGLDIGSAKLPAEERQGIEHYLIDVAEPEESFDVVRFQEMAEEAVRAICRKGRLPVLTGGTGFYIQALTRGVDFSESSGSSGIRERWTQTAEREGPEAVHAALAAVDPDAAAAIHPHNIRRVVRALEFYEQTGGPISLHNLEQKRHPSPYRLAYFVLTDDREILYRNIDRRVAEMMEAGLEEEVRRLRQRGLTEEHPSMKGIGYREFFPYFRGEYDLEETVRLIRRNTRHYAKRQLTWFRREPEAVFLDRREYGRDDDRILRAILEQLRQRGILRQQKEGTA